MLIWNLFPQNPSTNELKTASSALFNPLTLLFRHTYYLLHFTDFLSLNESLSSSPARSIAVYMIPLLPIYHHFVMLQYDCFNHHPPTFLLNLVAELHLLLGASDVLDHESGTQLNYIKVAPSFLSFRSKLNTHLLPSIAQ